MYDYIENAMIFEKLPKVGEKTQKYNFGYQNSIISKIEKLYYKDGYQRYTIYCMDENDYKNNKGAGATQYYYTIAIKIFKKEKLKMQLKQSAFGNNWLEWNYDNKFKGEAMIFEVGSKYGIDNGRISKFFANEILGKQQTKKIASYDRGWDIIPNENEKDYAIIYDIIKIIDENAPAILGGEK